MQHPYVPRCLSLQAALGFQSFQTPRGLPYSVPWAVLHLRHASLLFAFFFQYSKQPKENETLDHGTFICVLTFARHTDHRYRCLTNGIWQYKMGVGFHTISLG